jgi:esterase FrsA
MKNADEFRKPQRDSPDTSLGSPKTEKLQLSRRELLRGIGVASAAALTGAIRVTDLAMAQNMSTSSALPSSVSSSASYLYSQIKVNPFKDPAYAEGARQRLAGFSGPNGADPEAAKAIFAKLTSFDPEPWVAEWTKLAVPFEQKGAELESQGKMAEANKAYERASAIYGVARFPVINHPAKVAAYRKSVVNWRKAIRTFDPPMEIVEIPFEGKTIYGHLRKPKGVDKPAVIIRTGGVDGYKEGRNLAENLNIGCAGFEVDMPGAGECPVFNKSDSEKFYVAVIDYLTNRPDLDGRRIGFVGGSYGGYWGAKMAYVEPKRLKACIQAGGPIHYTWQEKWLQYLRTDEKEYFWPFPDSMIYANNLKSFDELIQTAPAMSLQEQGWLSKPNAPMLIVNGAKDPWISPEEIPLLYSTGQPKLVRVMADGKHMGRESKERGPVGQMESEWLKQQLS